MLDRELKLDFQEIKLYALSYIEKHTYLKAHSIAFDYLTEKGVSRNHCYAIYKKYRGNFMSLTQKLLKMKLIEKYSGQTYKIIKKKVIRETDTCDTGKLLSYQSE